MEHDERLPGVTFYVESAEKLPTDPGGQVKRGRVILEANINDFDVWDAVTKKLNGWRVYEGSDLSQAMVEAAQSRRRRAEEEAEKLRQETDSELQQLRQKLSFSEDEIRQLRKSLAEYQKALTERDELLKKAVSWIRYFKGCMPEQPEGSSWDQVLAPLLNR